MLFCLFLTKRPLPGSSLFHSLWPLALRHRTGRDSPPSCYFNKQFNMLTCFLSVFPRWDDTFLMILDQTEVENEVGVISYHRLVLYNNRSCP